MHRRPAMLAVAVLAVAVLAVSVVLVAGCSSGPPSAVQPPPPDGRSRVLRVVAGFYPAAWLATEIGGDRVSVRDITPAGAEPHDIELSAGSVDDVQRADLAIVMGRGFQPAVERAAAARRSGTLSLLDLLFDGADAGTDAATDAGTKRAGEDPHVWLDPVLMDSMATGVEAAMVRADPSGAAVYATNAGRVHAALRSLDRRYRSGLAACARKDIVTSHAAFGRLATRYGLHQEGIASSSPDAEPDPRRLAELADLVEDRGVTTIFTEELLPTRLADTLARETGTRTAVLSPLEALTADQTAAGSDYPAIMAANLSVIRMALGCT